MPNRTVSRESWLPTLSYKIEALPTPRPYGALDRQIEPVSVEPASALVGIAAKDV
jgi:hypothetical protein